MTEYEYSLLKESTKELLTLEEINGLEEKGINHVREEDKVDHLLSKNGLKALQQKLITIEQAHALSKYELRALFSDNGLKALQQKLIDVDEIISLKGDVNISQILFTVFTQNNSDNGLKALEHKLIDIKQLIDIMKTFESSSSLYRILGYLLSDNGLKALQQQLVTVEGVMSVEEEHYLYGDGIYGDNPHVPGNIYPSLFSETGLEAMRQGFITVQQANNFTATQFKHLKYLFHNEWSDIFSGIMKYNQMLKAKKEPSANLITAKKYVAWCEANVDMSYFFRKHGQMLVASDLLTLEQYLHVPNNQREFFIDNLFQQQYERSEILRNVTMLYRFAGKLPQKIITEIAVMAVTYGIYKSSESTQIACEKSEQIERNNSIKQLMPSIRTIIKHHSLLNSKQTKDPQQQHEFDKKYGITIMKK